MKRPASSEAGQTTTEYAILLGFIAIATTIAVMFLSNALNQMFSDAAASIDEAPIEAIEPEPPPAP